MRSICFASLIAIGVTTVGVVPAWAIAGGGFAPGGPMSGTMRPSCNGYNMDGTPNTAPGADRADCVDHSANALRRPANAGRVDGFTERR